MNRVLFAIAFVCVSGAAMICGAQPAGESNDELLRRSIRQPVLAVPLVTDAPKIDGDVSESEWANASLVSDLLYTAEYNDKRWGLPAQHRSRYWVQYTADALYVAARFDLPTYAPKPRSESTTHDRISGDDVVDILLNPTGTEEWHLSGNATGYTMDRNFMRTTVGYHWEPKTEYKARVIPGGWEAEYKIPFADIERKTPVPGERWRANFVAVRKTPSGSVSAWSYWPTWRPPNRNDQDGWLVFAGESVGVQFRSGADQVGLRPIEMSIVGKASRPLKIDAHLFKRNGSPKSTERALIANLAEWINKMKVGGSDFFGMTYEQIVNLAMKELSPVDNLLTITNAGVTTKPPELGEYLLTYRVTSGEGDEQRIIAAGALPFRVEPAVSIVVSPLLLNSGIYQVETDLSGVDVSKAKRLSVSAVTVADGKEIGKDSKPITSTLERLIVPAKDWPAGEYTFSTAILDESGQTLGQAKERVIKKDPPIWWVKREGMEPEVPTPWTPIEVQARDGGATVRVLGRTYEFSGLPVPTEIKATRDRLSEAEPQHEAQSILNSPMQLNVLAGGQTIAWKPTRFAITEQTQSKVVIETENTSTNGLTLKGKTTVEFDGIIRVDLELAGAAGGAAPAIDQFDLVIPFQSRVAQLLSNYAKAPGPGGPAKRFLGAVPKEPWKYPIFFTQFVGSNEVGLEWFCDNTKGWRIKKPLEATEVARQADCTTETFHFVDHSTTIESGKPIAITFGLIATPSKPSRKGWEIYRADQSASFPPQIGEKYGDGDKPATQAEIDGWYRRQQFSELKVNLAFEPNWSGREWLVYPVDLSSEHGKRIKYRFDAAHQAGQKVCPHGGWFTVPVGLPESPFWGYEMMKEPIEGTLGQGSYSCYNSPYTDFMVYNFAENARRVGIDGMRFDTTAPQPECSSFHHGCGWIGEDGKTYGSVNLFATREYFKRLYRVFHGGVRKDGVIYQPMGGPPINAIESFADIHEIGESNFQDAKSLKEGYQQADVRVRMTGTAYGLITSNNLKGLPLIGNQRTAALIVAGADPRLSHAGYPNYSARGYQNFFSRVMNTVELWNAWKWIDRGRTALWMPYWENGETIKLTPPTSAGGTTPELYASYYYQPGKKILLMVTNYERDPLKDLAVTLDLKKLGFTGNETLYGEDAITQEAVELEGGTVKLSLFGQRFRMVKISTDVPRLAESNLGKNILAGGNFEGDWPAAGANVTQPQGQTAAYGQRDTSVAHGGAASLCLKMTKERTTHGMVTLPPVTLAPGKYLLSGYVKIDEDFPSEYAGAATVRIAVDGQGIITDPPREFSALAGTFPIGERTPGWLRFFIPFETTGETKSIAVKFDQSAAGTSWFDDLQLQPVNAR